MRFVHSLRELENPEIAQLLGPDSAVGVTIGNFDGFHLGHEALFERLEHRLNVLSRVQNLRPVRVLLTFVPHPRLVLSELPRSEAIERDEFKAITPIRTKVALAESRGFDLVFAVRFTQEFAKLSPEQFIEQYLVSALGAQLVVVGYDWSFGKGREGSAESLQREGQGYGFQVAVVPPMLLEDERVSSRAVRAAIQKGHLPELEKLLGRRFSLIGRVVHGEARGREIGFPTANLRVKGQLLPPDGVYAVRVAGETWQRDGVANIGVRPSFGGGERLLEVHLLNDPSGELYGERIEVSFVQWIRPEAKFEGVEQLRAQIAQDVQTARAIHERNL